LHTIYEFTFAENIKQSNLQRAFCGCTRHPGIYNVPNRTCTREESLASSAIKAKLPYNVNPVLAHFVHVYFFNQFFLMTWKWRTVFQ